MEKLKKKTAYGLVVCLIALGGLATMQTIHKPNKASKTTVTAKAGYFLAKSAGGGTAAQVAAEAGVGATGWISGAELGAEIGGSVGGFFGAVLGAAAGAL